MQKYWKIQYFNAHIMFILIPARYPISLKKKISLIFMVQLYGQKNELCNFR